MVVLSAAIVTKNGKPLVARQYTELNRIWVEGLLASFPKLVGTGKQHTLVETENVRYVYQPLEDLYLLIVTDKQSNILEDLDTLRLLSKLVPEYCHGGLDEVSVCDAAFEIIFAFDEAISAGLRESVTVLQVRQSCEMESHEEKLHKLILQSKINETRDVMKKKAADIDKAKMEQKRQAAAGASGALGSAAAALSAIGSSSIVAAPVNMDEPFRPDLVQPRAPSTAAAGQSSKGPSKGMRLGKAQPRAVAI